MTRFLIFDLYGALSSWGGPAVGEVRGSDDHPSRSAILGMIAAALGIPREDMAAHGELDTSLGVATVTEWPGVLLRDYHTVQMPEAQRGVRWATRRRELSRDPAAVQTLLSTRDHYADARYRALMWTTDRSSRPLEALAHALERPRWVLYLGRKSCPPTLPAGPRISEADTLQEAIERDDERLRNDPWYVRTHGARRVHWDASCEDHGFEQVSSTLRRDRALDRGRWTFRQRTEFAGSMSPLGVNRST